MLRFYLLLFFLLPLLVKAQMTLYQDPQQYVWGINGSHLHRFGTYNEQVFTPTNNNLPNVPIQRLFFDSQKRLWIFSKNAPYLVYLTEQHQVIIVKNMTGLRIFNIEGVWESPSKDTLFFRDATTGVNLFLEHKVQVKRHYKNILSAPQYAPFLSPNNNIVFNTTTRNINLRPIELTQKLNIPIKNACFTDNNLLLLTTPNNQIFLIGGKDWSKHQLCNFEMQHLPELKYNSLNVTSLGNHRHYYLIGCQEGLIFLKKETTDFNKKISLKVADYNLTNTDEQTFDVTANYIRIGAVRQINVQGEHILLATANGIFLFKPNEQKLMRVSKIYEDISNAITTQIYISKNVIYKGHTIFVNSRPSLLVASKDSQKLIVTTEHGEIFCIQNNVATPIGELANISFKQLFAATDGEIWGLTNEQLIKININAQKFVIQRFNLPYITEKCFLIGNTIYFLGQKGCFALGSNQLNHYDAKPYLKLEGVKIAGKEQPIKVEYPDVESTKNTIVLNLLAIDPLSNGHIQYCYRVTEKKFWDALFNLKNIANWNYSYNKEVTLALESGSYQVEVAAINHFGVVSNSIIAHFTVSPPFWERWWFWLMLTLTLAGVLYTMFRVRERQLKIDNQLVTVELQALQAQMNTHFVANALTAIQGFVMRNDKLKANRYIVDFYTLLRLFLDSSRNQTHRLERELDLLERYVKLQQLFYKFEYIVEVGEDIYPNEMSVPTSLYQPFVENAIIHGLRHRTTEGAILKIAFERTKDMLKCRIEDNGIGRAQSKKINQANRQFSKFSHQVSTKIIEKRYQTLNQTNDEKVIIVYEDIFDAQKNAAGTRVTIDFLLEDNIDNQ